MLDHIELQNFKCFEKAYVPLKALNVFAGSNGVGKSTVAQALLLLFQNRGANSGRRLELNGPLVDLGTGRDVLYKRSESDQFSISTRAGDDIFCIEANVQIDRQQHTLRSRSKGESRLRQLIYLSADRLAPQTLYSMNTSSRINPIGKRGEFAPLMLKRRRRQPVTNQWLLLENRDKKLFRDLETQFTLWMARLFPGFEARTEILSQIDSVILGLSLHKQIGEPELFRPPNVGFGVSVALPVVIAGLLARSGSTFIVENPEAHLHPSAQSLLGEFLARVASGGVQVLVETHSDHVVNGIRVAVRNQILPTSEANFLAFTRTDEYGSHLIEQIFLNEHGDFSARPDQFFDQADRDLKLIYGF